MRYFDRTGQALLYNFIILKKKTLRPLAQKKLKKKTFKNELMLVSQQGGVWWYHLCDVFFQ